MTLLQNQTLAAPLNTLHDQGVPNTLSRMSPAGPAAQIGVSIAVLVAALAAILLVGAILVARLVT